MFEGEVLTTGLPGNTLFYDLEYITTVSNFKVSEI